VTGGQALAFFALEIPRKKKEKALWNNEILVGLNEKGAGHYRQKIPAQVRHRL
jgi:hypothetical protein